ncbi:hypothetical protein HMPREF3033_00026 [Veillonellaceae bacterium DNF00751]|nr:hypothetical protein HMPREF3033_00026 [Veillonellaceae bacterium DNF00751]
MSFIDTCVFLCPERLREKRRTYGRSRFPTVSPRMTVSLL